MYKMYRHIEYYPGDPILSLVETFKNDPRPEKVNLSIGIYFDDEGKMPVLESVNRAETARAAEVAGGRILTAKFPIANGFAAFIEDSEGNRIGLHSPA